MKNCNFWRSFIARNLHILLENNELSSDHFNQYIHEYIDTMRIVFMVPTKFTAYFQNSYLVKCHVII